MFFSYFPIYAFLGPTLSGGSVAALVATPGRSVIAYLEQFGARPLHMWMMLNHDFLSGFNEICPIIFQWLGGTGGKDVFLSVCLNIRFIFLLYYLTLAPPLSLFLFLAGDRRR